MGNFIKIYDFNGQPVISGHALHSSITSNIKDTEWIHIMINECSLDLGVDYFTDGYDSEYYNVNNVKYAKHTFTIESVKGILMMLKTYEGKMIRRWVIAQEKNLREISENKSCTCSKPSC